MKHHTAGITNKDTRTLVKHLTKHHGVTAVQGRSSHVRLTADWMTQPYLTIGLTSNGSQVRAILGDLKRAGFVPCGKCGYQ